MHDYDEAIDWFTEKLKFELLEDETVSESKRWVKLAIAGASTSLLLAKAVSAEELKAVGKAAGGRVAFFLETADFTAKHLQMTQSGVTFREAPRHEKYGTVAVFDDLYGNAWDLIEPT